jgi:hypothetical protein
MRCISELGSRKWGGGLGPRTRQRCPRDPRASKRSRALVQANAAATCRPEQHRIFDHSNPHVGPAATITSGLLLRVLHRCFKRRLRVLTSGTVAELFAARSFVVQAVQCMPGLRDLSLEDLRRIEGLCGDHRVLVRLSETDREFSEELAEEVSGIRSHQERQDALQLCLDWLERDPQEFWAVLQRAATQAVRLWCIQELVRLRIENLRRRHADAGLRDDDEE